jgi:glycosyltransferase involved in cell wall biosynthesis
MRAPISVVVLTKNEEEHLPFCLASALWAEELLVFDSGSTDRTVAIAERFGARVLVHPFDDFARQRNRAQAAARYDWVLHLDADERVSPELAREVCRLAATGALGRCTAYHIRRVHLFSGRWLFDPRRPDPPAAIRRSEVPRLVDRRVVRWERPLHEVAVAPEPRGVLRGRIYHLGDPTLSRAYENFNFYTSLEAAIVEPARRVLLLEAVARGLRAFGYHYTVGGLWRFGEVGLLLAIHLGYAKFMNWAKAWERQRIARGEGVWTSTDRALLERYPRRAR